MTNDNQIKINQLDQKLELLLKKQNDFSREINNLRLEINTLKIEVKGNVRGVETNTNQEEPSLKSYSHQASIKQKQKVFDSHKARQAPKIKIDVEKFIGENLINKIGIAILVIGVGIGARYSIEHDLISPLTRIILGYLVGTGLLLFGIKLKKNYLNYSAVLVSGAIAIMYFITYLAYNFYGLIPQGLAFGLMVFFTVFTVITAIRYNKEVIAHIGLVGAYAVPFLLSNGSGEVAILFSYMAIINLGILVISSLASESFP